MSHIVLSVMGWLGPGLVSVIFETIAFVLLRMRMQLLWLLLLRKSSVRESAGWKAASWESNLVTALPRQVVDEPQAMLPV